LDGARHRWHDRRARDAATVSGQEKIAMAQQTAKMSPHLYARSCGVLYAYILVAGTFAALFNAGILLPRFMAWLWLTLWFLVRGVNDAQWEESASREAAAR
jgi:hypothetical protein